MQIDVSDEKYISGKFETLKAPEIGGVAAQRLPQVVETVSEMLSQIESRGVDAVLEYSRRLDRWEGTDIEVGAQMLAASGDGLPSEVREAMAMSVDHTRRFAQEQRRQHVDFEVELIPGVITGQKVIPVSRVGAYLPAGRFPILTSAAMTVGVAKAAGVGTVIACTPPTSAAGGHPAIMYSAYLAGVDRLFALGGVQALAAMAFGLLGDQPIDVLVGAGNAYVAEAKRQLYGRVGIDLLAGPSEVAAIADETAEPQLVAADLLAQAEHGPQSPASLVTTSREFGLSVIEEIDRQLADLETADVAGAAWRDYGTVYYAHDASTAAELMDILAPEHLEIMTRDDDFFVRRLQNYGSLFLGAWSTVAYSDKGITGTNHVLPTGRSARYTGGLSVSRYLKTVTYQRVAESATCQVAGPVETIADFEGMVAHKSTATRRLRAANRQIYPR
ncbi:histidinol dehydrogenase [Microbacterium kribbense]|uniref:Histidinol dehydrogenase n=1 Tax=Microbacterium kribbense TaxID=433645 RepID=A0ABP7GZU0_9MICO